MKAYIGVDANSGLVHHFSGTAANVADITQTHALFSGQEKQVYADARYLGVEKCAEIPALKAKVVLHVAQKRSKVKALPEGRLKQATERYEKAKAQVCAMVQHLFQLIKDIFRHRKVRYRGLSKNAAQLYSLFAAANLFLARRALVATQA